MKIISTVSKNRVVLAIVLTTAISMFASTSHASDANPAYDNITVTAKVSANGAKRLGRVFLQERGFSYGIGAGAARIKSISRDGDTWVLHVHYSLGGLTMNHSALLYVNSGTALVSDVAPQRKPQQLAAQ